MIKVLIHYQILYMYMQDKVRHRPKADSYTMSYRSLHKIKSFHATGWISHTFPKAECTSVTLHARTCL